MTAALPDLPDGVEQEALTEAQATRSAICMAHLSLHKTAQEECSLGQKLAEQALLYTASEPLAYLSWSVAMICTLTSGVGASLAGVPAVCEEPVMSRVYDGLVRGLRADSSGGALSLIAATTRTLARFCRDDDQRLLVLYQVVMDKLSGVASCPAKLYKEARHSHSPDSTPMGLTGWLLHCEFRAPGASDLQYEVLRDQARLYLDEAHKRYPQCLASGDRGCVAAARTLLTASGALAQRPDLAGVALSDLRYIADLKGLSLPILLQEAVRGFPLWGAGASHGPKELIFLDHLREQVRLEQGRWEGALLALKLDVVYILGDARGHCERAEDIHRALASFAPASHQAALEAWGPIVRAVAQEGLKAADVCPHTTLQLRLFQTIDRDLGSQPPRNPFLRFLDVAAEEPLDRTQLTRGSRGGKSPSPLGARGR